MTASRDAAALTASPMLHENPDDARLAQRRAIRRWLGTYLNDLAENARHSHGRDDRIGHHYVLTLIRNFDHEWPTGESVDVILL